MARSGRHLRAGRRRYQDRCRSGAARRPAYAALDLGTNNCRLLIAHQAQRGLRVLDSFSRIVRLGEGVGTTGELSEAAMVRTIEALRVCAAKMSRGKVVGSRSVITAAGREARNRSQFVRRVRQETGIRLEVISAREEADLTLAGCLPLLEVSGDRVLLFDVGGGSAEFVLAKIHSQGQVTIEGCVSLPCGVVKITEKYGNHEFTEDDYQEVVESVKDMLVPFDREYGIGGKVSAGHLQVIGTAGTVTTLAGVNMRLDHYNRALVDGSWLEVEAIRRICRELAALSVDERAAYPCIGRARADLVVAGCAVLEAVCSMWPMERLRVADRGVREGILTRMMR